MMPILYRCFWSNGYPVEERRQQTWRAKVKLKDAAEGTNVPRRGVAIVVDQLKKTVQIVMHQSIAPLVFLAPNVSLHRGEMN
jgi:hypothetical protein